MRCLLCQAPVVRRQVTASEGVKDEVAPGAGGGVLAGPAKHVMVAHPATAPYPVGPAGFMSAAEVDTSLDSTRRPPAA